MPISGIMTISMSAWDGMHCFTACEVLTCVAISHYHRMVSLNDKNMPIEASNVIKTYTEQLSYLHLFRNYQRMWSLILLMFYISVVIAGCSSQWKCSGIDYMSVIIPLSANFVIQELVSLFLGEPITRNTLSSHLNKTLT